MKNIINQWLIKAREVGGAECCGNWGVEVRQEMIDENNTVA